MRLVSLVRWVWASISPGMQVCVDRSMILAPAGDCVPLDTSLMRPASITMVVSPSILPFGGVDEMAAMQGREASRRGRRRVSRGSSAGRENACDGRSKAD